MFRPLVFKNPAEFHSFFKAHQYDPQEGVTFVVVNREAYAVEHSSNSVHVADQGQREDIAKHLRQPPDFIKQGNERTAKELTGLLVPPTIQGELHVPPITELHPTIIQQPSTPLEQRLNDLAGKTGAVQAYEISPVSNLFFSPIQTNVRVTEEGSTNPAGYYAPMNKLTHLAQGEFPITTGICPTGSIHRCEAFWMLTQEKKTNQILDLTPPESGAVGGLEALSFSLPYYPKQEGEELTFGCIKVKNTGVDPIDNEIKLLVTNIKTDTESEITICHSLWDTPGLVEPERLLEIAERIQLDHATMVISEDGYREPGLAAIAEIMLDKAANDEINDHNKQQVLEEAIIEIRRDIGPQVLTLPEELRLLEEFIPYAVASNQRE